MLLFFLCSHLIVAKQNVCKCLKITSEGTSDVITEIDPRLYNFVVPTTYVKILNSTHANNRFES